MRSKPGVAPSRRDEGQNDPPVSPEELDIVRERLRTFEQDRNAASPVDDVMERLLRRHPAREPARPPHASR